jgi:hypothetical protein
MKTSHAFAAAAAITIFSGFWPANARPDSGQPTDSGVIPVTIVESEGRYTLSIRSVIGGTTVHPTV